MKNKQQVENENRKSDRARRASIPPVYDWWLSDFFDFSKATIHFVIYCHFTWFNTLFKKKFINVHNRFYEMQDAHPLSVRKIHGKIDFALPPAYRRFIRAHDFDMIEALYLTLATEKEGCRFNRGLLFSYNQDNGSLDYVRGVGVFNGNDAKAQYN